MVDGDWRGTLGLLSRRDVVVGVRLFGSCSDDMGWVDWPTAAISEETMVSNFLIRVMHSLS